MVDGGTAKPPSWQRRRRRPCPGVPADVGRARGGQVAPAITASRRRHGAASTLTLSAAPPKATAGCNLSEFGIKCAPQVASIGCTNPSDADDGPRKRTNTETGTQRCGRRVWGVLAGGVWTTPPPRSGVLVRRRGAAGVVWIAPLGGPRRQRRPATRMAWPGSCAGSGPTRRGGGAPAAVAPVPSYPPTPLLCCLGCS